MALKHLEISEMVGLTTRWVGAHRPLLQGIPQASSWLPQLDVVHARLVKAQPVSTAAMDAEIAEISARELLVDGRHDALLRATSQCLEAEQALCRASEPARLARATQCEQAIAALFPRGLVVINALYVAEAGYATRTRELLASEAWLRELLASIPTSGWGSLLSVTEAWCALGEQLGQLEEQKSSIQASVASVPQPPRSEMLAARNAWLALVNTMLAVLAMVEGHEEAIEKLRGPVLRTAEIAGKRYSPRDEADADEPETPEQAAPVAPAAPVKPGKADEIEPGMPGARPFV